jgi:hypothetical protein
MKLSVFRLHSAKQWDDWRIKDFLEKTGKEIVRYYPGYSWSNWGESGNILVKITFVPTEIRSKHLSNTSLESYR